MVNAAAPNIAQTICEGHKEMRVLKFRNAQIGALVRGNPWSLYFCCLLLVWSWSVYAEDETENNLARFGEDTYFVTASRGLGRSRSAAISGYTGDPLARTLQERRLLTSPDQTNQLLGILATRIRTPAPYGQSAPFEIGAFWGATRWLNLGASINQTAVKIRNAPLVPPLLLFETQAAALPSTSDPQQAQKFFQPFDLMTLITRTAFFYPLNTVDAHLGFHLGPEFNFGNLDPFFELALGYGFTNNGWVTKYSSGAGIKVAITNRLFTFMEAYEDSFEIKGTEAQGNAKVTDSGFKLGVGLFL